MDTRDILRYALAENLRLCIIFCWKCRLTWKKNLQILQLKILSVDSSFLLCFLMSQDHSPLSLWICSWNFTCLNTVWTLIQSGRLHSSGIETSYLFLQEGFSLWTSRPNHVKQVDWNFIYFTVDLRASCPQLLQWMHWLNVGNGFFISLLSTRLIMRTWLRLQINLGLSLVTLDCLPSTNKNKMMTILLVCTTIICKKEIYKLTFFTAFKISARFFFCTGKDIDLHCQSFP